MAGQRAFDADTLIAIAGKPVGNARGVIYQFGTTTPLTGVYAAETGGAAIATVDTDAYGHWELWHDVPRLYTILWTDHGGTAYYADSPGLTRSFASRSENREADVPTDAGAQTDEAQTWTAVQDFGVGASSFGADVATFVVATWATRPAAGIEGRVMFLTDLGHWYFDYNSAWVPMGKDSPETFNFCSDFGADRLGNTSCFAALDEAFTAMAGTRLTTPVGSEFNAAFGSVLLIPGGSYWCDQTIEPGDYVPVDAYNRQFHIIGVSGNHKDATFHQSHQASINFSTNKVNKFGDVTGFELKNPPGGSNLTFNLDNMFLWGAPAVYHHDVGNRCNYRFSTFRSGTTGVAPVVYRNTFWCWMEHCSTKPKVAADPGVLFETTETSDTTPAGNARTAWAFHVRDHIFDTNGMRVDLGHTTLGAQMLVDSDFNGMSTENFVSGSKLLHIRNTSTLNHQLGMIEMGRAMDYDGAGDGLVLECTSTGTMFCESIRMRDVKAFTNTFRTIGTPVISWNQLVIEGPVPVVTLGAPAGGSSYFIRGTTGNPVAVGTAATHTVRESRVHGDTVARLKELVNSKVSLGPGGASVADTIVKPRAGVGFGFYPVLVKAGVPTDGDYDETPPNGTTAWNSSTTPPTPYVRIAGVWTAGPVS